ncbi:HAMP domain-containing sensor histidine kinase [Luteococcus sp. H138]|uniref:sensor histidine kinase n=1 Tax=unclassified Luteococcus TaxID=2639923 RepID=UPI00313F3737
MSELGVPARGKQALAPMDLNPMGKGTLSRQLVLRVAGLVMLLALLLGTASTIAVRHQLINTVDGKLQSALVRSDRFMDDDHQGFGDRPPPGTEIGQITMVTSGSAQPAVIWIEDGKEDLAPAVARQLTTVASSEPTTIHLGGLDQQYRVQSRATSSGSQIVALPLDVVNHSLKQLILTELALTAAALLGAIAAARALVSSALKPLNRLAATATEVSNLALDRGEVALPQRVAGADADPANEVGRVGYAFNHMLENVESALATRQESETKVRQFVADASHELRNPLAAIRGYSELTRRSRHEMPQDTAFAMGRIEAESTRMSRLVEDMLLLARLDNDPSLDLAETDVVEVVLNAVSDAQVAGPTHDWSVDLPDNPVLARADALKLHQVVANLLSNACKHTPAGTHVEIRVSQDCGNAVIMVIDDGPGVDESIRHTAFERFARADTARAHNTEGSTGLGLAIVAAVMEAHGGSAQLDSQPGHTCFTLKIPLA